MIDQRVLIVEDSETLRFLAKQQFLLLGLQADTANNGQEAIDKYRDGNYSLILMDVMMPGITGLEATKTIRKLQAQNQRSHIPIVAVTAYGEWQECLASGMDDYLFKPVKLEDLRAIVSKWLPSVGLSD